MVKKYRNTNKRSKNMMLADTKDLKSLPFMECQFESGRGHHLLCIITIFNKAFTNFGIIKSNVTVR